MLLFWAHEKFLEHPIGRYLVFEVITPSRGGHAADFAIYHHILQLLSMLFAIVCVTSSIPRVISKMGLFASFRCSNRLHEEQLRVYCSMEPQSYENIFYIS